MRKVAILWLMLLAGRALAQPGPGVSVTREPGADDCPDTAALLARIELLRGRPDAGAPIRYHVAFAHDADGFRAEIRAGNDQNATRVLQDHALTCAGLQQATAVTLALLLDSDARALAPAPAPTPAPAPAPATTPAPASAHAPAPAPAPAPAEDSPRWIAELRSSVRGARQLTFALGGGGLTGVLRSIAPALNVELGLRIGAWRAMAGALWSPGLWTELGPGEVRTTLWSGSSRSCYAFESGRSLRLDFCSAVYAGALLASARGYDENRDAARFWLAYAFELALASNLAPLGWELSAAALLPFRRQDFSIDHAGVVYASRRVAFLLALRGVALWDL